MEHAIRSAVADVNQAGYQVERIELDTEALRSWLVLRRRVSCRAAETLSLRSARMPGLVFCISVSPQGV